MSRDSAIIGDAREERDTIHADHMGMTKFSTREDSGYIRVLHAIEMQLEGISKYETDAMDQNMISMCPCLYKSIQFLIRFFSYVQIFAFTTVSEYIENLSELL